MKLLRKVASTATAGVVAFSSLLTLAMPGIAHAAVQTCTWVGTAGDNKFSTATNWSNCNSDVPQADDILNFNTTPANPTNLTNDLTSTAFGGFRVVSQDASTGGASSYKIDTLTFAAGAVVSMDVTATVCSPNISTVAVADVIGQGNLTFDTAAINDMGNNKLKIMTQGVLTIPYAYTGAVSGSSASAIIISGPRAYTSATNCGQSGAGGGGYDSLANFTYDSLTIQNGASVSLLNMSKPMTLGGGSSSVKPAVFFGSDYDQNTGVNVASTRSWTSALTILNDVDVWVGDKTTVNFTGNANGSGKTVSKTAESTGTFNFNPSSNNTSSTVGTQVNQVKETKLEGTTTGSYTIVDKETATLSGTRDGASVLPGGKLKGTGTLNSGLYVQEGGIVAPGNSPGCITSDVLYLSGEYQFELGGTDSCTGYDQLKVLATAVGNTEYVTLDINSVLTTSRYNSYTPKQGQVFTIVDQAGTKAVKGTFKGLVEGATFSQNGVTFKISYVGGTGNDITLTVQNQPTTPDTGFALATAGNLVALGSSVVAAGGLVLISRKLVPQTKK